MEMEAFIANTSHTPPSFHAPIHHASIACWAAPVAHFLPLPTTDGPSRVFFSSSLCRRSSASLSCPPSAYNAAQGQMDGNKAVAFPRVTHDVQKVDPTPRCDFTRDGEDVKMGAQPEISGDFAMCVEAQWYLAYSPGCVVHRWKKGWVNLAQLSTSPIWGEAPSSFGRASPPRPVQGRILSWHLAWLRIGTQGR